LKERDGIQDERQIFEDKKRKPIGGDFSTVCPYFSVLLTGEKQKDTWHITSWLSSACL